MSSFFVFVFFAIIVMNIMGAQANKKKKKSWKPKSGSGQNYSSGSTNPWGNASQSQNSSPGQTQQRKTRASNLQRVAARQAKLELRDRLQARQTRQKDPADKNRNRTAGWGERESRGLMSFSNILIVGLLVGVVTLSFL